MTADHLAVLGPTCSWKSDTGLILAERLGREVLNCDSMQVYRGMDIGTGKPSLADRGRIRHHLIDCLDIHERCDAASYVTMADAVIREVESRGRSTVAVGGTGLYARALIYGMHEIPADPGVAAAVEDVLQSPGGPALLVAELEACCGADEVPAAVRQNPRRLARAVEVVRLTGRPPWRLQDGPLPSGRPAFRQYLIMPDMALLRRRIEARVAEWLGHGWIDEVRRLVARGLLQAPTARQALGYAQTAEYLAGGIASVGELQDRICRATVSYARRQRTWFRHQHPGAVVISIRRATSALELAGVILAHASGRPVADSAGEGAAITLA